MSFKLNRAVGNYVVVEPFEKSTVLRAEEISTVFKVISVSYKTWFEFKHWTATGDVFELAEGDLIIVSPGAVQTTMMGSDKVYYVRDSDVISTVKNE